MKILLTPPKNGDVPYLDGHDILLGLFPRQVHAAEFAFAERFADIKVLESPLFLAHGVLFVLGRR